MSADRSRSGPDEARAAVPARPPRRRRGGRRRALGLALALALGLTLGLAARSGPACAAGEAPPPAAPLPVVPHGLPVELVRTLQLLQDRIAAGSIQAHRAQHQLLVHIETRLTAAEPETWAVPENARAGVVFALAGGGPALLQRMLDGGRLGEAEAPLVLGALAYLEGREAEARRLLAKFDPRTVPASLAGQLALAQAAVTVRDAPGRALELLDLARLVAPGTLVEEAALRRAVFVVAQAGDAKRFETLSVQYLRRFRRSVYAGNFRQRFAAALTRLDFATDSARSAQLARMLDEIELESRRDLFLTVARIALDQGRRGNAIFAAERAAALAEPGSEPAVRARLYRAAALIVAEGHFEEASATLRGIDRAGLGETDARLLDAALSTALQIRDPAPAAGTPPGTTADATPDRRPPGASAGTGPRALPEAPAIARAQEALARIDRLMDRRDP